MRIDNPDENWRTVWVKPDLKIRVEKCSPIEKDTQQEKETDIIIDVDFEDLRDYNPVVFLDEPPLCLYDRKGELYTIPRSKTRLLTVV